MSKTKLQQYFEEQEEPFRIHAVKSKTTEVSPLPKLKSNHQIPKKSRFDPYQKGQKLIFNNPTSIFRINRPSLSRSNRIKTQHLESKRCQPVSPFFQKYISKSIQKRQSKYNLPIGSPFPEENLSPSPFFTDQHRELKHIFFDAQNILERRIIKLPQQRRQHHNRCKLKDRNYIQDISFRPKIQSKSLIISSQLPRSKTQHRGELFLLRSKDIGLYMSQKHRGKGKQTTEGNGRYQQRGERGQILTPWSFYHQQQL